MSVPLPAVKGTTSLMGCVPGQLPCACAPPGMPPASIVNAAATTSVCRRPDWNVFFMRLVSVDLFDEQ
jgi:hypothetical protein